MTSILEAIKNSAAQSGTTIQTSSEAKLEKILNSLFFEPKNIDEESKFVRQVMTRGLESQERVGLHASAMLVGDKEFCLRQQVLSLLYKQLQGEQISVGLARIFEQGNAIHEKWQRLLIRGGFGAAKDMDFTRYYTPYKLSFTPDIVCKIPDFFEGKMIGEIKSVNTYQFQKMSHHPSAWKQCQWYMHLCIEKEKAKGIWNGIDFTKGFVLNEDKNTQAIKVEVYDYDPVKVEPFAERADSIMYYYDKVINEHKMVKRPADAKTPQSKRCAECAMRDACWNIGIGRVKINGSN